MALTKCKECGHQISKSAASCPSCGAKIPKTSFFTKVVAVFFGLVFLVMLLGKVGGNSSSQNESIGTTSSVVKAGQTPEQRAEAQRLLKEQEASSLGLRWSYDESPDKMGRGIVKQAQVNSLNQLSFGFPYQGEQRGTLTLRSHPKYGRDVILSVEKGQFLCGIDDCQVAVRFDDGKATNYAAVGPEDHSTTNLFLKGHDRFVAGLRKAKRVSIEAQFYQEGNRVVEFEVRDLKWQ